MCVCVCDEIHLSYLVDTCRRVTLALDDATAENISNLDMPFNFSSQILKTNRRHAAKHEIMHKKSIQLVDVTFNTISGKIPHYMHALVSHPEPKTISA